MENQNEQQKQPISSRAKSQVMGMAIWIAFIFGGWVIGHQAGLADGRFECTHSAETKALVQEYGSHADQPK